MQQPTDNRGVVFSQNLYRRLLAAYPKQHRTEYGAAMEQLFSDQCRDAWREAGRWGLITLWLRVLPDLVKTSVLERLSTLNERKSMFQKMITVLRLRATPPATFRTVFAVVFLTVIITATVVTFIQPVFYASSVRMKIGGEASDSNPNSLRSGDRRYDPYLLQTEFEVIQSQAVLPKVIENLSLNKKWGKRFNLEGLTIADTMPLLRSRLAVQQFRNTSLMEVKVFSEDPKEAAVIANEIAEVYRNYRFEQREKGLQMEQNQKLTMNAFNDLVDQLRKQGDAVATARGNVDRLRQELNIPSPEPTEVQLRSKYPSYWSAKTQLQAANNSLKLLSRKVGSEETDEIHVIGNVTIVDRAEPTMRPSKPNKPLNLTLGFVFGILLATFIGGSAALVVILRKRTLRGIPATA